MVCLVQSFVTCALSVYSNVILTANLLFYVDLEVMVVSGHDEIMDGQSDTCVDIPTHRSAEMHVNVSADSRVQSIQAVIESENGEKCQHFDVLAGEVKYSRCISYKMCTVIYWYHCILRLSAIYNYAVDIVSLWCQIARASVTVTSSLNPDLVQDRRPFRNKSSFTNTACITLYKVVSEVKKPKAKWRGIELCINLEIMTIFRTFRGNCIFI